jgi:uncharacterized pyridoxamine 5'-phosphate oxidase family protein
MTQQLNSKQVWNEIRKEIFAVLGMVTSKGEARTIGIVYVVHDHKIYISTSKDSWKARHVQRNPHVSITVPIAKRIPFLPWIKIPAATITFSGNAKVFDPQKLGDDILHPLLQGIEKDAEKLSTISVLEIEPVGDFVTFGVGIPLMQMRFPEKARGRVPIAYVES